MNQSQRRSRELSTSEAQVLARRFHETYERLAPAYDYTTREESRVPWEDVPANNKALMVAVVLDMFTLSKGGNFITPMGETNDNQT